MSNEIYVLHDAFGNPVGAKGNKSGVKSYTTVHGANIARTNLGGKGHMKIAVYKPAGYVTDINGREEESVSEEDFNRIVRPN